MTEATANETATAPATAPATATETAAIDAGGDGTFTEAQLAQLEAWAREDGNLPAEDSPDDAAPVADTAAQYDAYDELVRPTDYRFEAPLPGQEPMPLQEQKEIAAALAAEGIPASIGHEFGRRWNRTMSQPVPTDGELELDRQQAEAVLRQQFGDQAGEMLRLARSEAQRLARRNPMIKAALEHTALGNDPWVCATLANMALAKQSRK